MERKLASVQKVLNVEPIEGADRIEKATIEGWTVVVPKGQVKKDDKVVYFEIDSFLPIRPEFEFLRESSYKKDDFLGEGFRLKTRRLKGIYSQGLVTPIIDLGLNPDLEVGTDLTETLGVKKWEHPEPAIIGGNSIGRRPDFIIKTSETRIQNEPKLLEELSNCESVYATIKLDGSSHTAAIDRDGNLRVTSHNIELKHEDKQNSFYNYIVDHNVEAKMKEFMKAENISEMYIQGEWCGSGIQNNKLMLKEPKWFVFNVYIDGKRQNLWKTQLIAEVFALEMVPIHYIWRDYEFKSAFQTPNDLLYYVENLEVDIYKNGLPEGLVIRPVNPVYSPTIHDDLSVKVINNKYLLKD